MVSRAARVLVVDDEEPILEFVTYNLTRSGYEVTCASSGDQALELAGTQPFDLIVLDIMLPGADGLEVCRRLRASSDVPVLFLSARDSEIDKVVGLEIGADDYLAKPFGIHELLARVKALLRRAGGPGAGARGGPAAGEIVVDEAAHVTSVHGRALDLTPREFELIATLARHAGQVLSRDQLLEQAWGWDNLVASKTVDTHVKRLRDKIAAAGGDPGVIETVRGYGYKVRL